MHHVLADDAAEVRQVHLVEHLEGIVLAAHCRRVALDPAHQHSVRHPARLDELTDDANDRLNAHGGRLHRENDEDAVVEHGAEDLGVSEAPGASITITS